MDTRGRQGMKNSMEDAMRTALIINHKRKMQSFDSIISEQSQSSTDPTHCFDHLEADCHTQKFREVWHWTSTSTPKQAAPRERLEKRNSSRQQDEKRWNSVKGRGQVKLAVYVNSGLLTVHVVQARLLSSKRGDTCNAFIKVCLAPDAYKKSKCQTEPVSISNHPKFDEKFSFELLPEDLKKRLLISVWNVDPHTEFTELLGCTSFGLWHIASHKKTVNGWYYLLSEDLGKSKHLQVPMQSQFTEEYDVSSDEEQDVDCLGEERRGQEPHYADVQQRQEPYVFMIPKGYPDGYGFGVSGNNPVMVTRVDRGSPADSSGLQTGDLITCINSLNVDQCSADTVARLIKNSGKKIILEVNRPVPVDVMSGPPSTVYGGTADCGRISAYSTSQECGNGCQCVPNHRSRQHGEHRGHLPLLESDYVDMSNWRLARGLSHKHECCEDHIYSVPQSTPLRRSHSCNRHQRSNSAEMPLLRYPTLDNDSRGHVRGLKNTHTVDVDTCESKYEYLSGLMRPSQNDLNRDTLYGTRETVLSKGSSHKLSSEDETRGRPLEDRMSGTSERAVLLKKEDQKKKKKLLSVGMCVSKPARKVRFCDPMT